MAAKKETKRKTKAEVLEEAGIAPTLRTDVNTRTFLARGIEGRDGSGPCKVLNKALIMPNGDPAEPGDTFDPVAEHMAPQRLIQLVQGRFIHEPKPEVLQACQEAFAKGYTTKPGQPAPESKPEAPDTGSGDDKGKDTTKDESGDDAGQEGAEPMPDDDAKGKGKIDKQEATDHEQGKRG